VGVAAAPARAAAARVGDGWREIKGVVLVEDKKIQGGIRSM
jgi:hypothetical protein